jgi:hypothetical protein
MQIPERGGSRRPSLVLGNPVATSISTRTAKRAGRFAVPALLALLLATTAGEYSASASRAQRATPQSQKPPADRVLARVDTTPPHVVSIRRRGASPTRARSVAWTVVFSEPVRRVRARSFVLRTAGITGTPAIRGVRGSGKSWIVTASTGARTPRSGAAGSLRLDLRRQSGVRDLAGNMVGIAFRGRAYGIDKFTPAPALVSVPALQSQDPTARFAWSDRERNDRFLCSFERHPFATRCAPPYTYAPQTTANGKHTFAVKAIDQVGNVSTSTSYTWTIAPAGPSRRFTIDGDAVRLVYPGAGPVAVAVTFHNPNDVAIVVTGLTVTMRASDFPAGCDGSLFHLVQASIPADGVQVPANGQVTLPAQGATAPTVELAEGGNQNTCRNVEFHFDYSGSAHS